MDSVELMMEIEKTFNIVINEEENRFDSLLKQDRFATGFMTVVCGFIH